MKRSFTILAVLAGLVLMVVSLEGKSTGSLYAWANPMSGLLKPGDHTWVSDYVVHSMKCPNPAKDYWYSAGGCHPNSNDPAPRPLSEAAADLKMAQCIAVPNDASGSKAANAQIRYGWDGVCHQISNRILAATGADGAKPITVEGARGYAISRFAYGAYGTTSQWNELRAKCGVPATASGAANDVQAMNARAQLSAAKVAMLQKEQTQLRQQIPRIARRTRGAERAQKVNAAVNASLRRLEESLGKEDFERFFQWPAGQEIELVNPEIAARDNS